MSQVSIFSFLASPHHLSVPSLTQTAPSFHPSRPLCVSWRRACTWRLDTKHRVIWFSPVQEFTAAPCVRIISTLCKALSLSRQHRGSSLGCIPTPLNSQFRCVLEDDIDSGENRKSKDEDMTLVLPGSRSND